MIPLRRVASAVLAALLLLAPAASTQTDVRIDITGSRKTRVHVESLAPKGDRTARATSVQADEVLAADLDRSAVFTVTRSWMPNERAFDVVATVGGQWTVTGNQVRLQGEVLEFPARRSIFAREYRGALADWRRLVHQFADDVVEHFTGERGVNGTRIAFSSPEGRNKELWVMDLDGHGLTKVTSDQSIALSPRFSPDGSLLLYTSYKDGRGPRVHVTPAGGGRSWLVSGRAGNNTSAAYSPDGREIAATLSLDGNPEIYRLDARGGSPQRLTSHRAIDTSPAWSPTGQEIAFTSDRSGQPQVHVMDRDGGNLRRLTYEVSYTDSPAWSPKGDLIAFVALAGSGFDLWVCRADGSQARRVATGGTNENPQWSPDGRHLVFSSTRGGSAALYLSSLDGQPPRKLDTGGRRAMNPAWSPRLAGPAPTADSSTPSQPTRR